MTVQLCRDCLWTYKYESEGRTLCFNCDSVRLTIPTSENLIEAVALLINRGIDVVSACCDVLAVYDDIKGCVGKAVQIQIELAFLYASAMFEGLSPGWLIYEYHTIEDHNHIGPNYTGLCHADSFVNVNSDELEFATSLTISNLELWLDNIDTDGFRAVWTLAGEL